MIKVNHKGNFNKIEKYFDRMSNPRYLEILKRYGREGVNALASATPTDSGETANSWTYEIQQTKGGAKIIWSNTNIVNGVPVAILIQYGHATKNGGYVVGRDYINPAMRPIFDKIANEVWKEVTK